MQKLSCEVNRENGEWLVLSPLQFFLEEGRYTFKLNISSTYFLLGDRVFAKLIFKSRTIDDERTNVEKIIFDCVEGKDSIYKSFDILIPPSTQLTQEKEEFIVVLKINRTMEYEEDPWVGVVSLIVKEVK